MDEEKRTIADAQPGERVAVRVRGQWRRWARVLRVTATQIVTTGQDKYASNKQWKRDTGEICTNIQCDPSWPRIVLPTQEDYLSERLNLECAIRQVQDAVENMQEGAWCRVSAEARAALDRMGQAAEALIAALATDRRVK
jgi:hypothetical protein